MFKTAIILLVMLLIVASCTNVQFEQVNSGPKGVNFTKGPCLVNDISAPLSEEGKKKFTALTIQYIQEMGNDSVISMQTFRSSQSRFKNFRSPVSSEMIDSLRTYTHFHYLVDVISETDGSGSNDITVKPADFQEDIEGKEYLDHQVSVTIVVFDIETNKLLYKQKTTAKEFVDTEDNSSDFMFTRSNENVFKNALTRGLKDLRKHSKQK